MAKKKKVEKRRIDPILILTAILIIVFFAWLITYELKFDPAKHVCELTCFELIINYEFEEAYKRGCESNEDQCVMWRDKTFCEQCVDDWSYEERGWDSPRYQCDVECECDEWEQVRRVNTSVIETSCVLVDAIENETMNIMIKTIPQSVDMDEAEERGKEIPWEVEEEFFGILVHISKKIPIEGDELRNITARFMENQTGLFMCFDFGGEYESIGVDNTTIEHNLSGIYYYEQGRCLSAHEKE